MVGLDLRAGAHKNDGFYRRRSDLYNNYTERQESSSPPPKRRRVELESLVPSSTPALAALGIACVAAGVKLAPALLSVASHLYGGAS